MRYRLSFELNTDTDPSQLLDLLAQLAETLTHEVDDESTEDAEGEPVDVPATITEETVIAISVESID